MATLSFGMVEALRGLEQAIVPPRPGVPLGNWRWALRQRLAHPEIHYFYPKEGYGLWSDNVVVLKEAKNVENAKLFQNFIMDPEVAAGLSAFHRYANGIAGSEKYMPDDMKNAPEVVIPDDVKKNGEIQVLCSPEVQDIYSKIWTELQK